MEMKKFITNNFGLKVTALFLALFVWVLISGKERSFAEKTLNINVEYFNVSENIDVSNVRPERIRITLRGTSKELGNITAADFKLRIDLKDISEGNRLNYFAEDHLQFLGGGKLSDYNPRIQPRMIEVIIKELVTREVSVRVMYKGKLKPGVILLTRKIVPDKVRIFGYKSEIANITIVEGSGFVELSEIDKTTTLKIPLKKVKEILRFEDTDYVEVFLTVENKKKEKDEPIKK